jgi:ankyrin repeat protein
LLQRGADVNARSDDGRTALSIAASRFGSLAVVSILLDAGADPSVKSPSYKGPLTPLREAADVGDEAVVRLLIERGANVKSAEPLPLIAALSANDARCVDLLIPSAERTTLSMALASLGPPLGNAEAFGNAKLIQRLLDHGADVNAAGPDLVDKGIELTDTGGCVPDVETFVRIIELWRQRVAVAAVQNPGIHQRIHLADQG